MTLLCSNICKLHSLLADTGAFNVAYVINSIETSIYMHEYSCINLSPPQH